MSDAQLQQWWPELQTVIVELRRTNHAEVADLLINAVEAGATSGEILDAVGRVLNDHRALCSQLSESAAGAWDAVLADVHRAYPGSRLGHWLARLIKRRG